MWFTDELETWCWNATKTSRFPVPSKFNPCFTGPGSLSFMREWVTTLYPWWTSKQLECKTSYFQSTGFKPSNLADINIHKSHVFSHSTAINYPKRCVFSQSVWSRQLNFYPLTSQRPLWVSGGVFPQGPAKSSSQGGPHGRWPGIWSGSFKCKMDRQAVEAPFSGLWTSQ